MSGKPASFQSQKGAAPRRTSLLWFGGEFVDDAGAFADGQDLIWFDLCERFCFLRGGPLHFDGVDELRFAYAEVQAEVSLRHYA